MIVIILPHAFFLNPAAPFSVEKKRLLPIRKGGRTISPAAKKNGAGLAIFRQSAIVISGRRDVGSPMNNLLRILAPALVLCVFLPVAAQERLPVEKVYLPDLVHETQLNFSPPGGNHIAIGWWIPQEYWINIFRNTTGSDPQSIDTALKLLRNYALLAVFQCDNERGNYRFYQQQQIASGLQVFYQPEEGRRERLRPVQDLPADLEVLIASITPLLTNVMGNMGRNFTFFVFQDLDVNGKRTVDPYLPGSLEIQLRQKNNKVLKKQLDFPLNSLFLPRLCPNGVPADASWKFCPWTGIRLPE